MIKITTTQAIEAREKAILKNCNDIINVSRVNFKNNLLSAIVKNYDGSEEVFINFIAGFVSSLTTNGYLSISDTLALTEQLADYSQKKSKADKPKSKKQKKSKSKVRKN